MLQTNLKHTIRCSRNHLENIKHVDFLTKVMTYSHYYAHRLTNHILFLLHFRFSSFSLTDSTNPFSEEDDDSTATDDQVPASVLEVDFLTGDWIQELPEDLDVCIAQRDFEGAVDHIIKGQ